MKDFCDYCGGYNELFETNEGSFCKSCLPSFMKDGETLFEEDADLTLSDLYPDMAEEMASLGADEDDDSISFLGKLYVGLEA